MTWPDATSVEVYFIAKGDAKSQVPIQHRKLPAQAAAKAMRTYWTGRCAALVELLRT